ncbi:hypothetical protein H257_05217 [Aphanomyces astaci]|uniref:DDE Tnp4 domain-containing protein n=1 Tax=Aphanomyces astaci TaxID=112090 RepID=W4GSH6_APHAT|nr:hypothetical protein H257_05217 [Aphanomyces astaci]ETV82642.1 hypothetical protein H257_05217 [Aphanomyces astaci]|eukprot:XP_009828311.1 hypothetical protein H257_05217 [Aphanomyces astaci]
MSLDPDATRRTTAQVHPNRTLTKAERALAVALKSVLVCFIRYPSKPHQRGWAVMVNRDEPLVRGVWGFLDGKNYRVKAPTAPDLQNATIVWGRHKFVGSWNDVDTSSPLRAKLLDEMLTLRGHGVVSDSAFPVSRSMLGKIRTPLKDGDLDCASPECRAGLSHMSATLTSVQQAAEWGMGTTEKSPLYRH